LKFKVYFENNIIENREILTFWNRKGELKLLNGYNTQPIQIHSYNKAELEKIYLFLIQQLEEKKHLGNYFLQIPNKLTHLYLAQKSGLEIPKTTITIMYPKFRTTFQ